MARTFNNSTLENLRNMLINVSRQIIISSTRGLCFYIVLNCFANSAQPQPHSQDGKQRDPENEVARAEHNTVTVLRAEIKTRSKKKEMAETIKMTKSSKPPKRSRCM